jgi:hypothetical protein
LERRKSSRQDVRGIPLKATLVLSGGSLLKKDSHSAIEIDAHPINLSQTGVCLKLDLDASWVTISPTKEVDLFLERGEAREPLKGKVVHFLQGHKVLGLEFSTPLKDLSRFLIPEELQ